MWRPCVPTWRQGTGEGEGGERRLEKEKYNFYCVVNKLVYVTPTVRENCAHFHLIFDLSTFLCFKRISEGHFLWRVIRRNGNYK